MLLKSDLSPGLPPAAQITRNWVERVLEGLSFCSSTNRELIQSRINYRVMDDDLDEALVTLIDQCQYLDNSVSTENSLLIFPDNMQHFYSFRLVAEMARDLMTEKGYTDRYQLEIFHPDFRFSDCRPNNPANYTNRSPYPTLHLLRKSSLVHALLSFPDSDSVNERKNDSGRKRNSGLAQLQCLVGDDWEAA